MEHIFVALFLAFYMDICFRDFKILIPFVNSSPIRQKGRISKQVLQENKARQIFQKAIVCYPLIRTSVFVSGGTK